MDENTIIISIFGIIVISIIYFFMKRYTDIAQINADIALKTERHKYYLQKLKLKGELNEEEDAEDEGEELPVWLSSMLQGADIDTNKIKRGDEKELGKVKNLLDKYLEGKGAQEESSSFIG